MNITLSVGVGRAPTVLAAYDAALLQAGVGNYNLIPLSSVIPPGAVLVDRRNEEPPAEYGHRLFLVLAAQEATEPGAEAWAGLGWVQAADGRGLFVEHHGQSEAQVRGDISASLTAMVATRPAYAYGPIGSKLVGVCCEGQPVFAVAVAVYESQGWGHDGR